ncbi:HAD family hydrolase [Desulfoluna sp.]|uniref:HAD family hydrolase n=1 Tax=Desulfoluna sp. TaxID=2045199 RepID=UPI002602A58D|nr:HAD family hydrolase [Desulfoluna sp.]
MQRMMITDFDGTLFRSDRTVAEKDMESLRRLGEAGVIRVIATGRNLYSFMKAAPADLPVDYLVFSTGVGIARYPNPMENMIREASLSHEACLYIKDVFDSFGFDYMVHGAMPHGHRFVYHRNTPENSDFDTRLSFYEGLSEPIGGRFSGPASQFLAITPETRVSDLFASVSEALADFTVIRTTSPFNGTSTWLEVFPKGICKSEAVSYLAGLCGIPVSHTMAVGNDYNDEDLLHWSGQGFVVGNAPTDLKSAFATVSDNDTCGVSEAIERWTPPFF